MRIASIDIGTNTVLLLVVDVDPSGHVEVLEDLAAITRLGEGIDRSGKLSAAAIQRTLEQVRIDRDVCAGRATDRVIAVSTSAVRDAINGSEFVDAVERELGIAIRVLTGEEEAKLSFRGALAGMDQPPGVGLVADIGGGSTELIYGVEGRILKSVSLPLGSVRLTERFLHSDPVRDGEFESMRTFVHARLSALDGWPRPQESLVGIAGTVTTLAAVDLRLARYSPSEVHGRVIPVSRLRTIVSLLRESRVAERKKLPGMEPGRADVILAGAVVLEAIMAFFECSHVVVSDRGLRHGLVWEEIEGRGLICRPARTELTH